MRMMEKGKKLAALLPNYRLLGWDPGFLFVSTLNDHRKPIDLPEDVVEALLRLVP
jgi:hypothetical protein